MQLDITLDDDLMRVLERIESRLVDKSIRKAVSDMANPIRQAMKVEAPKRSGDLRKGITKKSATADGTALAYVGINYKKTNIKIFQRGLFQERGTKNMEAQPFIAPVAERYAATVQQEVRELIESRLEELTADD